MIKKITIVSIFLCLLIAIPLSLLGIKKVEIGPAFMSFMNTCNKDLNSFKIAIPNIPKIPSPPNLNGFWAILNAFISFGNFIIGVFNVGITFLNIIIQLIEFLIIVIKNLTSFKDVLSTQQISSSVPASPLPIL